VAAPTRRTWFARSGFALLDQLLFAGANFAVNILLARTLPPAEYGAFALAFLVFMLIGTLHGALLTEPMLIFGAGRYADETGYVAVLLRAHVCVTAAAALVLAPAALVLWTIGSTTLAATLAALAGAAPFILLVWLLRRVFYVRLEPQWAAVGDGVYLAVTVAGLGAIARVSMLNAPAAIATMGVAGLVAAAVLLVLVKPRRGDLAWRRVASDHWDYGRWNVLEQSFYWISAQLPLLLVPLVLGLPAAAAVAAVFNLFRPLHPAMQSALGIMLPEVSARAARGEAGAGLVRRVRTFVLVYAGGVLAYTLVLAAVARPLLHAVYAGRYDGYGVLVLLIGLAYTASTVIQVLTVLLKATGKIRSVPLLWGLAALTTLPLAVPLMLVAGVNGAAFVFFAGYAVAAVAAWRRTRRTGDGVATAPDGAA
jgi:O-antigen/teichoic acid export membrane protein